MKIIIDARFFGTETGIGRYVKELVENLERVDSENQYVIFLSAKNFDLYQPKNLNFIKKLVNIKWYSLEEQLKLGGLVDAERADLAHFPHFNIPIFCRTPYVVTIHDLILRHFPTSAASTKNPVIFYLKYFFYNLVLRRALQRAKRIIVPTYFVKNDILKNFGYHRKRRSDATITQQNEIAALPLVARNDSELADKIRVISEGLSNLSQIDLGGEYLKQKNIAPPYLLYIGNAYPHKNLEKLIDAFAEVKKEIPELKLVLAGKRDYFSRRLELRATGHKRQDVIFYGYASEEDLTTLYKHASLYVFPSLSEGFGLPSLEALSFGLPVAVSDIPIFHEVLGNAAIYFNPNDIASIVGVIKSGLKDDVIRGKILMEANATLARYNWKKSAEETADVYKKAKQGR